jgi:hypothetical protein
MALPCPRLAELVGQCAGVRDPHGRRPFQRRAVSVQEWPIDNGVACSAVPAGVSAAAMSEAGDVSDEDLVRPEWVAVWAAATWSGDPLPARGLHQITQHNCSL